MNIDRHSNSKARQEQRRVEALARGAAVAGETPAQRIARLDQLFGPGLGAKRERERMVKRASKPAPTVKVHGPDTVEAPAEPKEKQKRRRRDEKRGS